MSIRMYICSLHVCMCNTYVCVRIVLVGRIVFNNRKKHHWWLILIIFAYNQKNCLYKISMHVHTIKWQFIHAHKYRYRHTIHTIYMYTHAYIVLNNPGNTIYDNLKNLFQEL